MRNRLLCITVVAWMSAVSAATAQTSVSDAIHKATSELSAAQKAEVDAFVKFCAGKMTEDGADEKVVVSCRQVMQRESSGSSPYKRHFAASVAANFAPVALKADQPALVLVNAAMVVGQLEKTEIIPVLKTMLAHRNPAVRYYGLKGYLKVRPAAVAEGGSTRGAILKTLAGAAKSEKTPAVLAAWMDAMDFSGEENDPAAVRQANAAVLAVLAARMQAVRDGDPGMAGAFGRGVQVVGRMAGRLAPAERAASLQALADIMANAKAAYGELSEGPKAGKVVAPPSEYAMLLAHAERSLLNLSGLRADAAVTRALDPNPRERDILTVKLKVNELIGTAEMAGVMQKAGVKVPTTLAKTPKIAARN